MATLSFTGPKLSTRNLTLMSVLIALNVILARFEIGTAWLKISPAFFAAILMGYYLGPWWAAVAAAFADQIGVLFSGGTNFLGFTLSAMVAAVIYGLFFYHQQVTVVRVFVAVFLVYLLVNTLMNTLWVVMLGATWQTILLPRAIKELVGWPIQAILVYLTLNRVAKLNLRI